MITSIKSTFEIVEMERVKQKSKLCQRIQVERERVCAGYSFSQWWHWNFPLFSATEEVFPVTKIISFPRTVSLGSGGGRRQIQHRIQLELISKRRFLGISRKNSDYTISKLPADEARCTELENGVNGHYIIHYINLENNSKLRSHLYSVLSL